MSDDDSAKPTIPAPATARAEAVSRLSSPGNTLVDFRPRTEVVRALVWRLAEDTANILWSKHALERMEERGITDKVALETMRNGLTKGTIETGKNPGEWKVKMTHQAKGRREVGVVVVTVRSERLLVKTVEWEDLT